MSNDNIKVEDVEFLDALEIFDIELDAQMPNYAGVLTVANSGIEMEGEGEDEDSDDDADEDSCDDVNSDHGRDSTDHSHDRDSLDSGGGSGGSGGGLGSCDSTISKNGKKRRRATKYKDEDSELIKLATTENLKSLNVDPNSKEGKVIKRKIRNRMSAQFHRERKKAYIDDLESLIKEKDAVIEVLRKKNLNLVKQNEELKSILNQQQRQQQEQHPNFHHQPINTNLHLHKIQQMHSSAMTQNPTSLQMPLVHAYGSVNNSMNFSGAVGDKTFTDYQWQHQHQQNSINLSSDAMKTTSHSSASSVHLISPMTSDGDESDGSVNGTSSDSTHQPTIKRSVSTYSLFSILFMISFALFGTHKSSFNSSSLDRQMALPSSLDSNKYLGDGMWSSKSFGLTHSLGSQSKLHTPSYWADEERLSSKEVDYSASSGPIFIDNTSLSSKSKNIVESSQSTALWVYQDRFLQLYPKDLSISAPSSSSSSSSSSTSSPTKINSKNLRASKDDSASFVVNVLPQHWSHNVADVQASSRVQLPSSSVNRVLMTSGAALLDPNLYINRPHVTIVNNQRSTSGVSGGHNDRVYDFENSQSREVSNWVSTSAKHNDVPSQKKSLVVNSVENLSNDGSESSGKQDNNVLVMLVPASSIRWGGSWSESKERDIHWILNQSYSGGVGGEGITDADPSVWLEIICTISRAHLVRNVTLTNSV